MKAGSWKFLSGSGSNSPSVPREKKIIIVSSCTDPNIGIDYVLEAVDLYKMFTNSDLLEAVDLYKMFTNSDLAF